VLSTLEAVGNSLAMIEPAPTLQRIPTIAFLWSGPDVARHQRLCRTGSIPQVACSLWVVDGRTREIPQRLGWHGSDFQLDMRAEGGTLVLRGVRQDAHDTSTNLPPGFTLDTMTRSGSRSASLAGDEFIESLHTLRQAP